MRGTPGGFLHPDWLHEFAKSSHGTLMTCVHFHMEEDGLSPEISSPVKEKVGYFSTSQIIL